MVTYLLGAVDVVPLDLPEVLPDLLPDLQVADLRLAITQVGTVLLLKIGRDSKIQYYTDWFVILHKLVRDLPIFV